ncbi:MAG: ATP-binding cassette domain-containing protein [Aeriscardovia sp.]|nr:ATP-binding cassette domain-containing protein [Aeriscardovia sp.]
MGGCLRVEGLEAKEGEKKVLSDLSFSLPASSVTVLLGKNGSGKTTLLKVLCGEKEKSAGRVIFPSPSFSLAFVPQNPASSMLGGCLREEMEIWGAEDLQVFDVLAFLGISHLLDRPFSSLSRGQVEICALACALCQSPDLVLLDEPLSPLDAISKRHLSSLISSLNSELGISFFIAEHDLEGLLSLSPRILALERGKESAFGEAKEAMEDLWKKGEKDLIPDFQKLYLSHGFPPPLTLKDASLIPLSLPPRLPKEEEGGQKEEAIRVSHLSFAWPSSPSLDIFDLSFSAFFGESLALVGENGSGKSTLLSLLSGLKKPRFGRVWRKEKREIFFLPQDPLPLLALEEGRSLGKEELLPLSSGERQKKADLLALESGKKVILLDEPGQNLDSSARMQVGEKIRQRAQKGDLVIFSTHDPAFCASFADRALCLLKGKKAFLGSSRDLVGGRTFFTTPFNRAFPQKNILTLKDCL